MNCSMPGFPVLHYLIELAQIHVHWVSDAIHLIFCRPLLLLPSIFPSIIVFSNELALHIRWPKYWNFNFSPSNKYPGLISFRIDWFALLAVQGTFKNSGLKFWKHQFFFSAFFMVQLLHPYITTGKTIALTIWTNFMLNFFSQIIFCDPL